MIVETATAIESIKAAISIVRGMKSLDDRTAVNAAIIDIQAALLDAQQEMFSLQETIQLLKARIESLERFDPERFELVPLVHDGHKYSGRKAYRDKETGDFYCPGCFASGKLVPIQFSKSGFNAHKCEACGLRLGSSDDEPPMRPVFV